jgi:hypothetical protein
MPKYQFQEIMKMSEKQQAEKVKPQKIGEYKALGS